jgi:hypothetical protein
LNEPGWKKVRMIVRCLRKRRQKVALGTETGELDKPP